MSESTRITEIDEQLTDLKGATDEYSLALRHSLLREKQANLLGYSQAVATILWGFRSSTPQDECDD